MLAIIQGTLRALDPPPALVDIAGGLTLEAHLPPYAIDRLEPLRGQPVTLYTRLTLESQTQGASFAPRLTAFPDAPARAFFELLTTVHGLGGRKALRSMAIPPADYAAAIAAGDATALAKLPEIGKKLAQSIITELHEKVAAYLLELPTRRVDIAAKPAPRRSPAEHDAIAALIALGQSPAEAERAISAALASLDAPPTTADQLLALTFGRV